jgi:tetratricopeptide (TPR) repeat protein
MARDRIVQADPEDLSLVLNLWSLRLSSLARLRLFNQASAEATNLFNALATIAPPSAHTHVLEHVLPFELDVIHARVKYWAGDAHGYTDALGVLLRRCRRRARGARVDADHQMWVERAARVGLIAASQFIEIKDFTAATALLEPLATQQHQESSSSSTSTNTNSELRSALGRVYLQAGQLDQAEAHFAAIAADANAPETTKALNAAFLASARGDWEAAGTLLYGLVEQDDANYAAVNNLAVALLGQGKLKEGIEVLEAALETSPSTLAMAEPFLFNLSTLYELRSSIAADKKRELLIEVSKWSGDGLRTTCLKMPS